MSHLPASRPQMDGSAAMLLVRAHGVIGPAILGQRGYYRDSMGAKGKNDRGVFDDMIAVVTPRVFRTFNGNTDPSTEGGRLAVLQPGVWDYKRGIHGLSKPKEQQYEALVQASPVKVLRDNGVKETGWFGINIHHAGFNTTTSAGCQTVYRGQWDEFFDLVCEEMEFFKLDEIPYVLTVREDE